MPSISSDTEGLQYHSIPSFQFSSGLTLDIKLAYRSYNPTAPKTVLIPTCFGGRVVETRYFIDGALSTYHVVVVAMLGNGESSSPSNDPSFPKDFSLRYQDCIKAQHDLVTKGLGINELEAVVGFSMGGQQAYYWAAMHGTGPNPFVKNAVVICGSAKTSGHNYAFLEGPISALEMSADYDGGAYREKGIKPTKGLRAFGRAYAAWLTSPEWFRQELWRKFGAESLKGWLYPAEGKAPFESWDAEDLLVDARMWQNGDVGAVAGEGDWRRALEGISARVLVMPSKTDQYFDWRDGEEEMRYLKHGVFAPIPTIWGHIGGGGANPEDVKWMNQRLEEFFSGR